MPTRWGRNGTSDAKYLRACHFALAKKIMREIILSEVLTFVPGADGLWLIEPAAYKAQSNGRGTSAGMARWAI